MFQTQVAIYVILIIALFICMRIINKGNVKNRKSILRLIGGGLLTAVSYTAFILIPTGHPHIAELMNGVYFICTDWLAIALILFVAEYTQLHPSAKFPRTGLLVLAGIDSVSLLVNMFTHHVFAVERVALDTMEYWSVHYASAQPFHLSFVYLMVAYCIALLVYKTVKTPRIYKSKFSVILLLLAAVIVSNLISVLLEAVFDYSVLLYGLLAISICYFVLYASPRKLLENMHSALAAESVIGLAVFDDNKRCVGVNQVTKDMFSQEGEIHSVMEQYLVKWEEMHQGKMKSVMGEDWQTVRDGEDVYIYVNYQQLLDEKGRLFGYSFQFENRTELIKRYEEEKYRATHDMLTGLLNREAFEEIAKETLAKAEEPYCMVCTNIKDFKLINEICGTEIGDALLIAQARLTKSGEYGENISARLYADRFCSILPRSFYQGRQFKESMTALIEDMVSTPMKAQFYIGVYNIEDVNEPIWTMCDKAMMAIDSIRNSYDKYFSVYTDEMFQRIVKEKEIIGSFDKALANEEFHMFLQPQISAEGHVVGAEALVRWIHPDKGMISPADFIPVLEKSGLIHRLDMYMWEKAAKKLEEWKRAGRENLSISVNISAKDFYLTDISAAFRAISEKYDFNIKNLKLEITESALMRNIRRIAKNMEELHALGFDIEIDDFGSGYSSLGMLKDIHADILKLDMIFMKATENITRSTTIIKNVISMSKELGMPVITEGVETKEQLDFLQSTGCDIYQGYYFAKPMQVEEFESMYSA